MIWCEQNCVKVRPGQFEAGRIRPRQCRGRPDQGNAGRSGQTRVSPGQSRPKGEGVHKAMAGWSIIQGRGKSKPG